MPGTRHARDPAVQVTLWEACDSTHLAPLADASESVFEKGGDIICDLDIVSSSEQSSITSEADDLARLCDVVIDAVRNDVALREMLVRDLKASSDETMQAEASCSATPPAFRQASNGLTRLALKTNLLLFGDWELGAAAVSSPVCLALHSLECIENHQ